MSSGRYDPVNYTGLYGAEEPGTQVTINFITLNNASGSGGNE